MVWWNSFPFANVKSATREVYVSGALAAYAALDIFVRSDLFQFALLTNLAITPGHALSCIFPPQVDFLQSPSSLSISFPLPNFIPNPPDSSWIYFPIWIKRSVYLYIIAITICTVWMLFLEQWSGMSCCIPGPSTNWIHARLGDLNWIRGLMWAIYDQSLPSWFGSEHHPRCPLLNRIDGTSVP